MGQIDMMVKKRFPDGHINSSKFKVQLARMGEPSLNPAVLDLLQHLPDRYDVPGLIASLSTVAPRGASDVFMKLIDIKDQIYPGGRFQLQFSIHTTDQKLRSELIPIRTWTFKEIGEYGARFCRPHDGDRKIALNFALASGSPISAKVLREYFDPEYFVVKLTPLNPTIRSEINGLRSLIDPNDRSSWSAIIDDLEREGYDHILSIGEIDENLIGSNCGQYIQRAISSERKPKGAYDLRSATHE